MNTTAGSKGNYTLLAISLHKSHNPGSLLFCPGCSSLTILTILTCKFGLVAAQRGPCVSIPRPHNTPKKASLTLTLPPCQPLALLPSLHQFPPVPPHSVPPSEAGGDGAWRGFSSAGLLRLASTAQQSRQPAQPPPVRTPPPSHPSLSHHHHGEIRMVPSHFRATQTLNDKKMSHSKLHFLPF